MNIWPYGSLIQQNHTQTSSAHSILKTVKALKDKIKRAMALMKAGTLYSSSLCLDGRSHVLLYTWLGIAQEMFTSWLLKWFHWCPSMQSSQNSMLSISSLLHIEHTSIKLVKNKQRNIQRNTERNNPRIEFEHYLVWVSQLCSRELGG